MILCWFYLPCSNGKNAEFFVVRKKKDACKENLSHVNTVIVLLFAVFKRTRRLVLQVVLSFWCGRRDSNPHTTKVTEPKSVESANSTTPADMSGRASCRYFIALCFYTARNRGGA